MCVKHEPVVLVISSANSVIIVCFQDHFGSFPFFYFSYNACTVLDPLDAVVICLNLLSYSNEVCSNFTIKFL